MGLCRRHPGALGIDQVRGSDSRHPAGFRDPHVHVQQGHAAQDRQGRGVHRGPARAGREGRVHHDRPLEPGQGGGRSGCGPVRHPAPAEHRPRLSHDLRRLRRPLRRRRQRPAAPAQGRDPGGARMVRLERSQRRHAREQHRDVVGRDPERVQAGEGLRLSTMASWRCPSGSSATPRARPGPPTRRATSRRSAGSTRRRPRRAASPRTSPTRSSTS